jgi:hypothetical protein
MDIDVDPLHADRRRFVLKVDADEFDRVSRRLGAAFGRATTD